MKMLEQFFLSHPDLMRLHFDSRPWIWGVCALGCLWLSWMLRNERTTFEIVTPPIRALRCFRFCWLAGFPAMAIQTYTSARGIQARGWVLGFGVFCEFLSIVLLVMGTVGILHACFREAREKQRDVSSS